MLLIVADLNLAVGGVACLAPALVDLYAAYCFVAVGAVDAFDFW